jgi:hypothetical protein
MSNEQELKLAVANLIKQKGRHNTEVAYKHLVEVYDSLASPSIPPAEQEPGYKERCPRGLRWENAHNCKQCICASSNQEVVAWVRRHPDGALSPNELLSDERIEESRKKSGAWIPLCRCAPKAAMSEKDLIRIWSEEISKPGAYAMGAAIAMCQRAIRGEQG